MRRIAVINQKGGVGKTTTAAHLGSALGLTGSRVLLIDMDPQAHLSLHFGVEVAEDQASIYDVLTASLPMQEATISVRESVHLVPSDIDLAAAEAELISVMGREVILREALDCVEDKYDVLLIDCPPSLGVLTINALAACQEVVIPLQAQFFALQGLGKLLDTVRLVQQRINPTIIVKGVALCMHDSSTKLSNEIVDDLTEFLSSSRNLNLPWSRAEIFKARIRRNVKLAESSSFGQTVFEYEPKSNGAIDYSRLANEIFDCPVVPGLGDIRPSVSQDEVTAEPVVENVSPQEKKVISASIDSVKPEEYVEVQAQSDSETVTPVCKVIPVIPSITSVDSSLAVEPPAVSANHSDTEVIPDKISTPTSIPPTSGASAVGSV